MVTVISDICPQTTKCNARRVTCRVAAQRVAVWKLRCRDGLAGPNRAPKVLDATSGRAAAAMASSLSSGGARNSLVVFVEGQAFHVERPLLTKHSQFFRKTLEKRENRNKHKYMNTGELEVTPENVDDVFNAAFRLHMSDVVKHCIQVRRPSEEITARNNASDALDKSRDQAVCLNYAEVIIRSFDQKVASELPNTRRADWQLAFTTPPKSQAQDEDTICPNFQQNIIVVSTATEAHADKYQKVSSIKISNQTFDTSAYEAAADCTSKGVICGIPLEDTARDITANTLLPLSNPDEEAVRGPATDPEKKPLVIPIPDPVKISEPHARTCRTTREELGRRSHAGALGVRGGRVSKQMEKVRRRSSAAKTHVNSMQPENASLRRRKQDSRRRIRML
ncbi:hypothetical protein HPB50_012208 [Hyalomma asiaticum]|uniref:Uncharacterized protein n=1 Tax=Hyalomma asiaticum TaxID=266040 RepID=A0ACB7SMZ3_HYAAI|nr:hypothetical protein HPB50_012208 [Hyalomma asiaticum]